MLVGRTTLTDRRVQSAQRVDELRHPTRATGSLGPTERSIYEAWYDTSLTSSTASSPDIREARSTSSCPGPMPRGRSKPRPENTAYRGVQAGRTRLGRRTWGHWCAADLGSTSPGERFDHKGSLSGINVRLKEWPQSFPQMIEERPDLQRTVVPMRCNQV